MAHWPVLLALALAAAAGWLFSALAGRVTAGATHSLDRQLLLALRDRADASDPLGPAWVEELMRDFTALGGIGVLALVTGGAMVYLLLSRRRHAALAVLVAVLGGGIASILLKLGFDRARPDLVPHGSHVYTASFPSGHAMMAAVTYLTLGALVAAVQARWRVRLFLVLSSVLVTVVVGVSRVYLGVHWPSDVLGGWMAGAAWALACWAAARALQRRGQIEPAAERSGHGS